MKQTPKEFAKEFNIRLAQIGGTDKWMVDHKILQELCYGFYGYGRQQREGEIIAKFADIIITSVKE